MKNPDTWSPTKYIHRNGRLIASRDPREVGVASRLMADLTAELYDANLKLHAKGKLLDLGCGKAPLYAVYRHRVSESVCVDWENSLHRNDHLDLTADLTKPLPFDDGEFDTIILSDVLEHIPEPELLCREMARVLLPGGRLIMNVPFLYWLHEQPHDYYRYTEFALRNFMMHCGMQLLLLHRVGGVPEVLTDILAKNVVRLPILGRLLSLLSQSTTSAFVHTSFGRKVSQATAKSFPIAYFLVAEKPG